MNNLTSSHPPIVITVYPSNSSSSDIVWKIERKRISLKKLKKSKEQILIVVTHKCCWWCTARHNSHPNFVRSERSCFLPFGCQGPLHTIKVEVNPHLVTREWTRCNTLFSFFLWLENLHPKNGILAFLLIFFLEVRLSLEKREMPNMEVYFRRRHHLSRVHNAGRSSYFLLFSGDV